MVLNGYQTVSLKYITKPTFCEIIEACSIYLTHQIHFKQLTSGCSKKKQMKKNPVNTGQVMFSGEIYYYWPLNSSEKVDKIVSKTSFFFA